MASASLLIVPAIALASKHNSSGSGGASVSGYTESPSSSENPFGRQTLRKGMSGRAVTLLQFYLDAVGYPTAVDGQFASQTKHSVVNFQRGQGIPVTGVVGRRTGRSLGGVVQGIESIHPQGKTHIKRNGFATPPPNAPPVVRAVIGAANRILHSSYCYAGGHGSWKSSCYDCSGAVSFALHGGSLLSMPEDSTQMESYGAPGPGHWITIYADSSHAFLVVAGRAFDTANFGGPNKPAGNGPRWRWHATGNFQDGGHYVARHPPGL